MKKWILIAALLTGCVSPEAKEAGDQFAIAYDQAMEDGVITASEAENLKALASAWADAGGGDLGGIDWTTIAGGALGLLLANLGLTNMYRNRNLPGSSRAGVPGVQA